MIDSHHHLWQYRAEEYPWMDGSMQVLRQDYLPHDLKREMERAGVTGVVSVQARQSIEETRWLLELARECKWVLGVVGWLPLLHNGWQDWPSDVLDDKKLKGIRHVVQDEPTGFLDQVDFNTNLHRLLPYNLCYDLLIYERQLVEAIRFVDRHPQQVFVIDHLAKPRIREGVMHPWNQQMRELARRPNVVCKVSGLAGEADWKCWTAADLRPYMDTALDAFGAKRLMIGSDWPVSLLACEYTQWFSLIRDWVAPLSHEETASILEETAVRVYQLRA
jgi:L-fuconolactonase